MTNVETQNDSTKAKESLFNDSPRIVKMTLLNLSVFIYTRYQEHSYCDIREIANN